MKELKNYKNNSYKKNRKKILFFYFFIFSFLFLKNCFAIEIPKLENYVNDYTNTLTSSQKNEIENNLKSFNDQTTNQVVVLIISSLNDEYSLEDYSLKVAEKNKIGTEKNDNGVLLTIIKNDKKLRIEVGYGLEGFITDAKSSYIIRNFITPQFKNNNYYLGINNGLSEIKKSASDANYLNDKIKKESSNNSGNAIFSIIITILMIVLFIKYPDLFLLLLFSGGFNNKRGRFGGGSSSGNGGFGGFSGGGGGFGGGGSSGSW